MANEKEVKQLEAIIESMKAASNALVKVYPTASLTMKYMSDDIAVLVADLKGRTAALDAGVVPGPNESAQARRLVIEKANEAHQKAMQMIGQPVFDLEQERAKLKAEGRVI